MQENPAALEVRQVVAAVLPELAKTGSLARALPEMTDLYFVKKPSIDSLLEINGTHRVLGKTDLRLYKRVDGLGINLALEIIPVSLDHKLFFVWYGGVLNNEASRLYGHLQDQVDFCFDFSAGQFKIRSLQAGAYELSYPFDYPDAVNYSSGYKRMKSPVHFSGFDVGNNVAGLTIGWAGGRTESITLPAVISQLDLLSLP